MKIIKMAQRVLIDPKSTFNVRYVCTFDEVVKTMIDSMFNYKAIEVTKNDTTDYCEITAEAIIITKEQLAEMKNLICEMKVDANSQVQEYAEKFKRIIS